MCLALAVNISEDSLLSHTGNIHTIVPAEALEYLSNHFSWHSLSLWEWGITTYYQVLWDMNNVQFLPVNSFWTCTMISAAHWCKLNMFLGKGKQPQTKPTALKQTKWIFNNLAWWKRHMDGKINQPGKTSAVKSSNQCEIITTVSECMFQGQNSASQPPPGRIEVTVCHFLSSWH